VTEPCCTPAAGITVGCPRNRSARPLSHGLIWPHLVLGKLVSMSCDGLSWPWVSRLADSAQKGKVRRPERAETHCSSQNSSIAEDTPKRPHPLSFMPPNGICGSSLTG